MSKRNQEQQSQQEGTELPAGADTPAEPDATGEVQSTEPQEQSTETEPAKAIGIGQFVRHLLLHSTKTNSEILELVLKTFEGSKTTPACIAWYKTDLRKKGLLEGLNQRGKNKTVALSAEDLAELCK